VFPATGVTLSVVPAHVGVEIAPCVTTCRKKGLLVNNELARVWEEAGMASGVNPGQPEC
jgi:hypothetical protein